MIRSRPKYPLSTAPGWTEALEASGPSAGASSRWRFAQRKSAEHERRKGQILSPGNKEENKVLYINSLLRQRCCWTPYLNTKDDNWERGETNIFSGSAQIGAECHGFAINDGEQVELTLKHKGNDGGLLDHVSVHGAFGMLDHSYKCRSGGEI